jgi:hypothetical protein
VILIYQDGKTGGNKGDFLGKTGRNLMCACEARITEVITEIRQAGMLLLLILNLLE